MLKTRWIAVALMLATTAPLAAPPSDASLERLLEVTRLQSMMDGMYAQTEQMVRQGMARGLPDAAAGGKLNDAQQRIVDELPARFGALMREEMSWTRLKPKMLVIYRESFNQQEIDGLIAFYESPLGQVVIERMPLVMQKSMQMVQADMQGLMPRIQALMEDTMHRVKAAR